MKTATSLRRILLTLIVGAAGAVFALVPALATAAGAQSFQISPPVATYSGDHGNVVSGKVKVTNLTTSPLSIRVVKQNFVAKGEEGEIELVDNADPLYSLAPWFNFDTTQLDLAGQASKEINYTISIPADAEPGGRYGSVVLSSIPPKLPSGQSGASVQQQIAGIVFMRINGKANEKLQVASFGAEKGFYESGPVKLLTRVKNVGTVHEKPTGTITIKNMFGFKVTTIKLDEHYVIPGAIRRMHNQWSTAAKQPFMFGRYTATLDAKYGDGQTLTASAAFTVIPIKQTALVVIILVLLLAFIIRGRKRLARALRILAGKE